MTSRGRAAALVWSGLLLANTACSEHHPRGTSADPTPSGGTTSPPPGGGMIGPAEVLDPGEIHSAPARPHDAGLLSVAPGGAFAVASDPIGEAVYVVPLDGELGEAFEVQLEPGDEPGRAALNDEFAYVTLPRSGALAVVQLDPAELVARHPVCAAPQGVAVDGELIQVACRGGELMTLDGATGEILRDLQLDGDLRDVIVWSDGLLVTRFLTAEVLHLDSDGREIERLSPPTPQGGEAALAWRTLRMDATHVVMVHQTDSDPQSFGGYSGDLCGSLATSTVTILTTDSSETVDGAGGSGSSENIPPQWFPRPRLSATGTVDATLAGDELLLAYPGNAYATNLGIFQDPVTGDVLPSSAILHYAIGSSTPVGCAAASQAEDDSDVPLALAAVPRGPMAGAVLVLSEFPAQIKVLGSDTGVTLHDEDRRNTGLELFQVNVGAGVACASCHPTGRPDARVWRLPRGPRRTQSLEGGVSQRGAFHWDAEFEDFGSLVDDVLSRRMGLVSTLTDEAKQALLAFIDSIPATPRLARDDSEAAARGERLFSDPQVACSSCHPAPTYSDNLLHDVGTGGNFVTPSLLGVAARAPLLHDGCARDLTARFGLCGGGDRHGVTSQLSDAELEDLVAFMTTL